MFASTVHSAEEQTGYIIIRPDRSCLPPDSLQQLHHAEMLNPADQTMDKTPPLAYLDDFSGCAANIDSLIKASRGAAKTEFAIVGLPGIDELHLPLRFAALANLATKAATAAFEVGALGKRPIALWLESGIRPFDEPNWHDDVGLTFLNCSNKASTVFALNNADYQYGQFASSPETAYVSPIAGMPVAFARILHSHPYRLNGEPSRTAQNPSSVLAFHETSNVSDSIIGTANIGSPALGEHLRQLKAKSLRLV